MSVIAMICKTHGFVKGDHCPECAAGKPKSTVHINTEEWVKGWYEHIDKDPIYIRDKQHLFAECEKRGHIPKAFMKPRSQGQGYEIRRRVV